MPVTPLHLFVLLVHARPAALLPHSNHICMAKRWKQPEESHSNHCPCPYVDTWLPSGCITKKRWISKYDIWRKPVTFQQQYPHSQAIISLHRRGCVQCCIDHLSVEGRSMKKERRKINYPYVVYNQISEEKCAWLRGKIFTWHTNSAWENLLWTISNLSEV